MSENRVRKFFRGLCAHRHEGVEFGQVLLDLSQVRKERADPILNVGSVAGRWLGEKVGWLVAALGLLVLYYIPIWMFTGLWFLCKYLCTRSARDSQEAEDEDSPRVEVERRRVPQRLRLEIARDQRWKCFYGKSPLMRHGFHIDHVVPKSRGGSDERTNLVASCPKHNAQKSDMDLDEFYVWMEENQQESCYDRLGE